MHTNECFAMKSKSITCYRWKYSLFITHFVLQHVEITQNGNTSLWKCSWFYRREGQINNKINKQTNKKLDIHIWESSMFVKMNMSWLNHFEKKEELRGAQKFWSFRDFANVKIFCCCKNAYFMAKNISVFT